MANFHPSDEELLEFSAGSLDWAISICVSAHLQQCPRCKQKAIRYNELGAELALNKDMPSSQVKHSPDSLKHILNKIRDTHTNKSTNEETAPKGSPYSSLPKLVQKLISNTGRLKWRFVSPSLKTARLISGQDKYEVAFHNIKQGGKVAEHDHRGREVTLVLQGSFSDSDGNYVAGDYLSREAGEVHRPQAAQNEDCLCLSVLEAPVKLTGLLGKCINPFLNIRPQ